jgi:hypothetical protein
LAGFGVQTLSVFFISQIGQAELAAAVLACSVFNATGACSLERSSSIYSKRLSHLVGEAF